MTLYFLNKNKNNKSRYIPGKMVSTAPTKAVIAGQFDFKDGGHFMVPI